MTTNKKRESPPNVSHNLATKVSQGGIHSRGILKAMNGFSIFFVPRESIASAEHVQESTHMLQLISQGGQAVSIDMMQQMMVHNHLEVMSSITHFINILQAYAIVLQVAVYQSITMVSYKTDILDGLYEWMAILENHYQNQRKDSVHYHLHYIWRATTNHSCPCHKQLAQHGHSLPHLP